MERQHGLTVVELIVVLLIVIIISTIGLHNFRHLLMQAQANEAILRMNVALRLARQTAMQQRRTVTVCGSTSGGACNGSWSDQLLVFIDDSRPMPAGLDAMQHTLPAIEHGDINWRAFRSSRIVQFHSSGLTLGYNGTFVYCPKNKDPRYARGLVLNKSGRIRVLKDSDQDGIVNVNTRENLSCP